MIRQTFLAEAEEWVYSWGTRVGQTEVPAFTTPNSLYYLVTGFGTGISIFGYTGNLHNGESISVLDYTKTLKANGDLQAHVCDLENRISGLESNKSELQT